jgi:hypothetical protein
VTTPAVAAVPEVSVFEIVYRTITYSGRRQSRKPNSIRKSKHNSLLSVLYLLLFPLLLLLPLPQLQLLLGKVAPLHLQVCLCVISLRFRDRPASSEGDSHS